MQRQTRFSRTLAMVAIAATAMVGMLGMAGPAQADTAFSVSGTLTGKPSATAAAVPLAGVRVFLSGTAGNNIGAYAYTDASGHWSISKVNDSSSSASDVPLAAGTYAVQFNCNDANSGSCNHDYVVEYLGHTFQSSDSTKVTLTSANPTATADDELACGAAVSGTVTTATGGAVAGAYVFASPKGGFSNAYTTTAADGSYTLDQLATANEVISANFTDYVHRDEHGFPVTYSTQWFNHAATESAATPLSLVPSTTKAGIDFALSVAPSVTGRVVDAAGNGVPALGMDPLRFDPATDQFVSPNSGPYDTNDQGYFKLTGNPGFGLDQGVAQYKLLFSDYLGNDNGKPQTRTPFETTWYHDASSFDDATVITLPTSGNTDLGTVTVVPHTGALRFIGNPVIQDSQSQDGSLTINGDAPSPGTATRTAQWYRNGTPISGATTFFYAPTAADQGTVLTVTVTAKLGAETATATSAGYNVPSEK